MGIKEYLDTAIRTGNSVTIKYIKYEGEYSVRTISNLQYSDEYGDDYIQAFCHKRQEKRTFKISRILSVDDITNSSTQCGNVAKKSKSAYSGNASAETDSSKVRPVQKYVSSTYKTSPSSPSSHTSSSYNKPSYTPSPKTKRNEGCYIATMAYGDYDHPQVVLLRKYRDDVLMQSFVGRMFVRTYYFISPKLVKLLCGHKKINAYLRKLLDRYIEWLNL